MCRLLGVQSNNYYRYQKRQTDKPDGLTHQEMLEGVKDIARFSDNTYGETHSKSIEYAELSSESQENSSIDERSRRVGAV
ncbi:hypothetical protein C427_5387 [Paraglaciecola psychrophila 170]|uniref:Uncharacterized protein n=2 Tax=Paraglaciecola psychrophila 170 TaxID=1129794 RepID=M4RF28_9ALTE|nr:hypothetical protein C427_0041 [Paraglaciecola psychrophila 170]AGH46303.1 hypothetical protein C427_4198 [Paraglaciecola psychrophila 170]AGH47484.1 hypothetical protein C427_5387 [Paraglaciecola psychrophila 170]